MDYDAWLTHDWEAQEKAAARLEAIAEPWAADLIDGQFKVTEFAGEDAVNALWNKLCAIVFGNARPPAVRLAEVQKVLADFADRLAEDYALETVSRYEIEGG